MTRQKSFKTRVRARMDKTGEGYTTARQQLLDKSGPSTADTSVDAADLASASTGPSNSAGPASAGGPGSAGGVKPLQHSDSVVRQRTGKSSDEWYALLDAWGGTERTHTEIARWLVEEHRIDGWWAQSVTVAYEQARGMRAPGQKRDGFFSANATKIVYVPVERLFDAFADPKSREQWLPGAKLNVRTATAPKSFRADWLDDSTRIVVGFEAKGEAKAQVAVSHEKLTDAAVATRHKSYWRERLTVLKQLLET